MSTVILKWNPAFSSYTMARFLKDLEKCALDNDGSIGMNWSVWDYDHVAVGDTCYLLKVGFGQTGIVARGTITSNPYADEDWAFRTRRTMYCDFDFEAMINPDAFLLLTSAQLTEAIPGFDWTGGHSGLVLTPDQADELERQWGAYLRIQSEYFEKASDQNLFLVSDELHTTKLPYSITLDNPYGERAIGIEFTEGNITCTLTISNYHRLLGKLGIKSWRALRKYLYDTYPTPNTLMALCATLFANQIEYRADFYHTSD